MWVAIAPSSCAQNTMAMVKVSLCALVSRIPCIRFHAYSQSTLYGGDISVHAASDQKTEWKQLTLGITTVYIDCRDSGIINLRYQEGSSSVQSSDTCRHGCTITSWN